AELVGAEIVDAVVDEAAGEAKGEVVEVVVDAERLRQATLEDGIRIVPPLDQVSGLGVERRTAAEEPGLRLHSRRSSRVREPEAALGVESRGEAEELTLVEIQRRGGPRPEAERKDNRGGPDAELL